MISGIKGSLQAQGPDWVFIEIGGSVTLQVSVPSSLIPLLGEIGQNVRLYTKLVVREDDLQLYGFPTPDALHLFNLLIGVSGIGPRTALSLLSARSPEALVSAILSGDLEAFGGVPGVGKKTAARVILELKGKLEKEGLMVIADTGASDAETLSALTALGYTAAEARNALRSIGDINGLTLEEKVRLALSHLARGR
jgi:Holliday junction DNA helicase RuvA